MCSISSGVKTLIHKVITRLVIIAQNSGESFHTHRRLSETDTMEKFESTKPDGNGRHRRGLREKTVESEVDRDRVVRTWLIDGEMLLHRKDIENGERIWVLLGTRIGRGVCIGNIFPLDVRIGHTTEDTVPPVKFASTSFLPGPIVNTTATFKSRGDNN